MAEAVITPAVQESHELVENVKKAALDAINELVDTINGFVALASDVSMRTVKGTGENEGKFYLFKEETFQYKYIDVNKGTDEKIEALKKFRITDSSFEALSRAIHSGIVSQAIAPAIATICFFATDKLSTISFTSISIPTTLSASSAFLLISFQFIRILFFSIIWLITIFSATVKFPKRLKS